MSLEQLEHALDFQQNYEHKVKDAAKFIKVKLGQNKPTFGIVLGSGLGDLANSISNPIKIPYTNIPNFPVPSVDGHEGTLYLGELEGVSIIGLKGRTHYYEVADEPFNNGMLKVIFPVHVLAELGVKNYFVTNAAGGLNLDFSVGDVMIIKSHINHIPNALLGRQHNFLRVDNNNKLSRFQPMNEEYDPELNAILSMVTEHDDLHIHEGKYIGVTGPTYETRGECIAFRDGFKADAVGMSTTPEVIVAKNRGMNIVGFSCITNKIDKYGVNATNHEEVKKILESEKVKNRLSTIVTDFFRNYRIINNL